MTSNWFEGTADAVQQNFSFIKKSFPDLVLILSGDHIYTMDYEPMISFHLDQQADLTIGTIKVPIEEASRFGILGTDTKYRVTSFLEKPENPPSTLANMGVYLFNRDLLDKILWDDHLNPKFSHDFGKNIIPKLIASDARIFAFPYSGYWMDVGTFESYWQAHMDMLSPTPKLKLYNRDWIIHTRTRRARPGALTRLGSCVCQHDLRRLLHWSRFSGGKQRPVTGRCSSSGRGRARVNYPDRQRYRERRGR